MTLLLAAVMLLLQKTPSPPSDPCKLGAEALVRRDLVGAEENLKRCLRLRPAELSTYLQLCALYQLQDNSDALHQVASLGLRRFPGEKRFYLTVGNRAGRQGRFQEAIEIFTEGFRRWPDDPGLRKGLAGAHASRGMELLDGNDNKSAEMHLRRAVELDPEDLEALLNHGRSLHNLNQSTGAVAAFDRVLSLDGKLPLAHFHRGMVLYGMGEYGAAIADLRKEIEINPDYPPSYLFRGLALMAGADWKSALTDLEVAALRMPDNPKASYSRARCLYHLGRHQEAEEGFRKTIELDPLDPGPVNALARLLLEQGRGDEARQLLQKAAALSKKTRSAAPGEIRFESPPPRKSP